MIRKSEQTWITWLLLQIPKHLLKVSILVIICSFCVMFYIINNEASLQQFLESQDVEFDFTHEDVHPLFRHMQNALIRDP